jgi:phage terminase large subunit-like protein
VAKKPLAAIRNQFLLNSEFRYFFKEFCPKPNKEGKIEFGTSEQLTVPNRTKGLKEPTLMCAGVGTNITGLHFDWMKIDDLVNRESVSNETQIQASKDYYSLLRPIFDNPTVPREDVIGTIYHFNDLHCNFTKNKEFEQSFIPVEIKGEFVFPERINKENFATLCNDPSMNPHDVQSQYYLNPIDPSKRKFFDEWIAYYDKLPDELAEYMLGDPASTVKKTSDYTTLQRWGIDADENAYLLDGVRDKLLSNQRVELYLSMAKQSGNLKGAKYEVIGGRHGDLENIRDKFLKEKIPIEPQETKATSASKQDRIEQRLAGRFHAKKIFLPRKMPKTYRYNGKPYDFVQEYLLEYRQFPFSEHDDIMDCHSQLFDGEYLIKGGKSRRKVDDNDEFEWWRNQTIRFRKPDKKRFIFGNKRKMFGIPATESYWNTSDGELQMKPEIKLIDFHFCDGCPCLHIFSPYPPEGWCKLYHKLIIFEKERCERWLRLSECIKENGE